MNILLINPRYPYGKAQTYLGGSLTAVGAQMLALGHFVRITDLNHEDLDFCGHDVVGVSVSGSPYIPSAIEITRQAEQKGKKVLIGGQVIAKLGKNEFETLFGKSTVQIKNSEDLARALESKVPVPRAFSLSLIPVWKTLPDEKLKLYLKHEMALVVSQGCHFQCAFCAAEKKQKEEFKSHFEEDLEFLVSKAKEFGIKKLEFYASSLDFFQNPEEVEKCLRIVSQISKKSGVRIKIRCLACMSSFMKAYEVIPEFKKLLRESGLWCIGFGIDGIDAVAWSNQKKIQNKTLEQVWRCLETAEECGVTAETLLVMGFPEEGWSQFFKYLLFALKAIRRHKNVVLRPYLAKAQIPGNDYWGADNPQRFFAQTPERFMNLDFCAVGSPETHPRRWQRYGVNIAYLIICALGLIGKCYTSPLMPVGSSRMWNKFAKWWNRVVPFDR